MEKHEEGDACRGPASPRTTEDKLELAERERDRAIHALQVSLQLVARLKRLVGDAFEEGFRRRDPAHEVPWLVDWLQSDSKRDLDAMLGRRPSKGDPR
ncbi:MAG: hypothetical protein CSA66_03840 [Proteobacteria bacterium]|nr:MAG: hypothetical protein CSA66_03840 [Pseudomonadota bacterium]